MVTISRKYSLQEVSDIFRTKGCKLLAESYKDNKQKLPYICECGNKSEITLNKLLLGRRCRECGRKKSAKQQRLAYSDVQGYFERKGCILLTKTYTNNSTKLEFKCSCGRRHSSTFDTFKKANRCRDCWVNSLKGKSNPNYNPSLTDQEREYKRISPEYVAWRKSVFERDSYACVRCESHGYLEAHHLNGFHWFEKGRYAVNNGVTLCSNCHDNFHAVYGRHNNTKAQYDEWISERSDEKSA